jgi:hypothetical protein
MFKSKHKNILKLIGRSSVYLLVSLLFTSTVSLTLTRSAKASTFSVTDSSTACPPASPATGGPLNPPYHAADGYTYYCVVDLKLGEAQPAVGGKCPTNIAGMQVLISGRNQLYCLTQLIPTNVNTVPPSPISTGDSGFGPYSCGGFPYTPVKVAIGLGCKGIGNPILDALFAIIRFLSYGVGLVIIASTIVAGIQYSASRGDPNATAQALGRVRNNLIALLIFILSFPIINWLIPNGLLH